MNWGPQDWIGWAGSVKAFFSAHGSIVTKLIVSMDREGEFFMAAIDNPDKYGSLINAMDNTLHGVKVVFTTKLPADRMLFESVCDRAA
jgi:hypothetical protein